MSKGNTKKIIVIYGCGGHARSVADVALQNGVSQLVFVDENARVAETMFGFDVLRTEPLLDDAGYIVAIGCNHQRAKQFFLLKDMHQLTPIIADDAHVGRDAQIDPGVFVGRGAHIGPNVKVGENTIINTHCVIEHDCVIGKHSHVSVNAVIAGRSQVGDYVMIGTGATVIDKINICSNVIVGAGAVVVKDILEAGTYVGVPARKIK